MSWYHACRKQNANTDTYEKHTHTHTHTHTATRKTHTHRYTTLSGRPVFWRCKRQRLPSRPSPRTRSAGRVARVAAGRQGNRASAAAVPRPGPGPAPAPPLLKERRREGEEERGIHGEQERGEY